MWKAIAATSIVIALMVIWRTWPKCGLCNRTMWPWQRKMKAMYWGKDGRVCWVHSKCFYKA